jgi:glycosyltransferase involved in cell wall biosynthesis
VNTPGSFPFFSIITPCYNNAATLSQTLACLEMQAGVTVEHLIIDGGSIDGCLEFIRGYSHNITVIAEPDLGSYDAVNKGIRIAIGEVVGILNADDFYPSADILVKVARVFKDPAIDACYGDLVYIDRTDIHKIVRYWRSGTFAPIKFYWGWMPPHPTFFVRRSAYERFGLFNLELGSAADYELMLRFLVKHEIKAVYIPEVLVKMRTGGISNISWRNRIRANKMDRRAWVVNNLQPYLWTLWVKPLRKVGQWVPIWQLFGI